jgi:hypothetical protein
MHSLQVWTENLPSHKTPGTTGVLCLRMIIRESETGSGEGITRRPVAGDLAARPQRPGRCLKPGLDGQQWQAAGARAHPTLVAHFKPAGSRCARPLRSFSSLEPLQGTWSCHGQLATFSRAAERRLAYGNRAAGGYAVIPSSSEHRGAQIRHRRLAIC